MGKKYVNIVEKYSCLLVIFLGIVFSVNSMAQNPEVLKKVSVHEGTIDDTKRTDIQKNNVSSKDAQMALDRHKAAQKLRPPLKTLNDKESQAKQHFILHLESAYKANESLYFNALNQYPQIESLRLVDSRRTISLANGEGSIELLSGNELLQLYGRKIRPQNIRHGQKITEIELVLYQNMVIKEQLIK